MVDTQQAAGTVLVVDHGGSASREDVSIYYELHAMPSQNGSAPSALQSGGDGSRDRSVRGTASGAPERMLLIMGFAATSAAWYPLVQQLQALWGSQEGPELQMLLLDNRGVGQSSSPRDKAMYSTRAMAQDALSVMDHVGWDSAHVVGFSMGGMIATKLAAAAPSRVRSLALLSVTGGGAQVLPRSWRALKYALKAVVCGGKSLEHRAESDLKFHFSKGTLRRLVPGRGVTVRDVLRAEYLAVAKSGRPQPECGFRGQAQAVWDHSVTDADVRAIRGGKFPVWYLHGRHDLVATPSFAEQLAARFAAPCVLVEGAHFIPRENAVEVSLLLRSLISLAQGKAGDGVPALARGSLEALQLQLDLHAAGARLSSDSSSHHGSRPKPNGALLRGDSGAESNGHAEALVPADRMVQMEARQPLAAAAAALT